MEKLLVIFVIAWFVASSAVAQQLGTLFTTPEEREYLDYLREDFLARTADAGFDIDDNAVPEIPEDEGQAVEIVEFHLDGIMTQSDGRRAVWLNGEPIFERDLPSNASIVSVDGSNALQILDTEKGYILKPGQTVNISTGQFWDAFENTSGNEELDGMDVQESQEIDDVEQELIEEGTQQDLTAMQLIESLQFFQEDVSE